MAVSGIGGIFFRARDPKALAEWYAAHFGVGAGAWGLWHPAGGASVFAPVATDSDQFPTDRPLMLNFRVDDLDDLLKRLAAAGIEAITRPEWDSEIGRFARIHDPEGNPVELWEPAPGH